MSLCLCILCFFYNDTATTEIYTLSLHDALPILRTRRCKPHTMPPCTSRGSRTAACAEWAHCENGPSRARDFVVPIQRKLRDRKSTRLNSSHLGISYAVFCLKKKKNKNKITSIHY